MILAIFGSRSLEMDKEEVGQIIEKKIKEIQQNEKIEYICIPWVTGACMAGFQVAEKLQIPAKVFFYQSGVGWFQALKNIKKRSQEIVNEADYFIIIHDGKSTGTINDLKMIKKAQKKYYYHVFKSFYF